MSDYPAFERIVELQRFITTFGKVLRVPHLGDTGRAENDIEHSYGLALTCWYLAPKIVPELDLSKILQYAIAHDTVEIYAGDTFSFGKQEHIDSKPAREDAALEQLSKNWPDFTEMVEAAKRYKDKADEEAKFVFAVDKILPVVMVNLGEKAKFWNRHKITVEMQKAEKEPRMRVSKHVWPYYDELVEWMTHPDHYYKPD